MSDPRPVVQHLLAANLRPISSIARHYWSYTKKHIGIDITPPTSNWAAKLQNNMNLPAHRYKCSELTCSSVDFAHTLRIALHKYKPRLTFYKNMFFKKLTVFAGNCACPCSSDFFTLAQADMNELAPKGCLTVLQIVKRKFYVAQGQSLQQTRHSYGVRQGRKQNDSNS